MKDYNYTHKEFKRDSNSLLQRFNNNEVDLDTYRTENKNLLKKLSTKEILKDSRGLNTAARMAAIDQMSRKHNIDQKKLEELEEINLSQTKSDV